MDKTYKTIDWQTLSLDPEDDFRLSCREISNSSFQNYSPPAPDDHTILTTVTLISYHVYVKLLQHATRMAQNPRALVLFTRTLLFALWSIRCVCSVISSLEEKRLKRDWKTPHSKYIKCCLHLDQASYRGVSCRVHITNDAFWREWEWHHSTYKNGWGKLSSRRTKLPPVRPWQGVKDLSWWELWLYWSTNDHKDEMCK